MPRNSLYKRKLTETNIREELKYPFRVKTNGKLDTVTKPIDILVQRIKFFLVTGLGERLMESSLGSGIPNLIGKQLTDEKINFVKDIVTDKIQKNFKEISVEGIELKGDEITVNLKYKDTVKSNYFDESFDKYLYENNYFSVKTKLKVQ